MNMEKELITDRRKATADDRYAIQMCIIRYLKKGKSWRQIAKQLDVSYRYVYTTKKTFEKDGILGIKAKVYQRRTGSKFVLSAEQEKAILKMILEKSPKQLGFSDCMWTRNYVGELIQCSNGIVPSRPSLRACMDRWGLIVDLPILRAHQHGEKTVSHWLESEFPGITERVKQENAEIFFVDEMGVPLALAGQKSKVNMLSAVSHQRKQRFILYKDKISADKLIDFMSRLIRDTNKKAFLIQNSLRADHAKKVTGWLLEHKDDIEVFYWPPYVPDYDLPEPPN